MGRGAVTLPLHYRYVTVTGTCCGRGTKAVTLPLHYCYVTVAGTCCGRGTKSRYATVTLPLHCRYRYVLRPWNEEPSATTRADARARLAAPRTAYMGMASCIDEAVGAVAAAVEALGETGDTLLAFTSDHGDHMGAVVSR